MRICLALVVIVLVCPGLVAAQDQSSFLALDIAGGFVSGPGLPSTTVGKAGPMPPGWGIDTTLRFYKPWLGVTGSMYRTKEVDTRFRQYTAGVRVNSPYGGEVAVRGFVHALTGVIQQHASGGRSDSAIAVMLGGGIDTIFFLRMQGEYVRVDLPGIKKNSGRVLIGGVLPLCFQFCRDRGPEIDGINVSGQPGVAP